MHSLLGTGQSSQNDILSSEPPSKKRRTRYSPLASSDTSDFSSSQSSHELPAHSDRDYIEVDDELLDRHASKYDAVMHRPAYVESQHDIFVTQADHPPSSPTRIRGPVWRKKTPTPSHSPQVFIAPPAQKLIVDPHTIRATSIRDTTPLPVDEFDDDELDALIAGDDFSPQPAAGRIQATHVQQSQAKAMRQTTLFGSHASTQPHAPSRVSQKPHNWPLAERNESPTHHKINEDAMTKWIFPLNIGTIRDYQYNIVHKSLFNNVLVALPTGLGKTFIAAAVMMNWYNWTKEAQLVFMAPTKPLVAQQTEACFHIAGIPRSQTTLMTGEIPNTIRADEWQTKRVFFMTPQTLINDLKTGIADPKKIVLLVVDEAHKATGNYAYTEVVRFLRRFNNSFRVLALTATPGSTVEAVQKVIDGLDIARVEIRTEDSIDIQKFVHRRNVELEYFDYSDEINMCIEHFGQAVKPVVDKLSSQNIYWGKDPTAITAFGLHKARQQWSASDAGRNANWGIKGMINACFTPLASLAHNLELLKFHGIGPFYHKMKRFQDDDSGGKYAKMVRESKHFLSMMTRLRGWIQQEDFIGHPKLEYLKSVVLNHFLDAGEGTNRAEGRQPSDTRIMIFAHYRDSAEEICRVLNRHQPMIRAHVFVGQASTKGSEGMDQKTQTDIIKKFKGGTYNTLVATSIGEEGLDIGEVDLIVCYDCSKSPIRMLQRMGRTGRKRAGNIVMLLMRGKEEKDYLSAKDNYQKIQEIIESGREFVYHEDNSPRIVPKGIEPEVSKERVEIPIENTQPGSVEPSRSKKKGRKKIEKKFHMPDGVETGFTFLGKKRANAATEDTRAAKKQKKKARHLDKDLVDLPVDSEVYLSAQQEAELSERYACVAGEDEAFVPIVTLTRYPDKVRKCDKTRLLGHSKRTSRIIGALRMAADDSSYTRRPLRPLQQNIACSYDDQGIPDVFGEPLEAMHEAEAPFWVSQDMPVASQNEGLLDLSSMFDNSSKAKRYGKSGFSKARKRVISDDEDE